MGQVKKSPSNGHEYKVARLYTRKKDRQEKEKTRWYFSFKDVPLKAFIAFFLNWKNVIRDIEKTNKLPNIGWSFALIVTKHIIII